MRVFVAALAVACVLAGVPAADAGTYGDELSKCLVRHTSAEDQIAFVQWVFGAIALHPDVKALANISDEQRAAMNAKAGALFVRLLTKDCREESLNALRNENEKGFEDAFEKFGEQATAGLLSNPAVDKGLEGLTSAIDTPDMRALLQEAGVHDSK